MVNIFLLTATSSAIPNAPCVRHVDQYNSSQGTAVVALMPYAIRANTALLMTHVLSSLARMKSTSGGTSSIAAGQRTASR